MISEDALRSKTHLSFLLPNVARRFGRLEVRLAAGEAAGWAAAAWEGRLGGRLWAGRRLGAMGVGLVLGPGTPGMAGMRRAVAARRVVRAHQAGRARRASSRGVSVAGVRRFGGLPAPPVVGQRDLEHVVDGDHAEQAALVVDDRNGDEVEPQLVAEITYLTWTADGLLRLTVFIGLQSNKPATEVRREAPPAIAKSPRRPEQRTPNSVSCSNPNFRSRS